MLADSFVNALYNLKLQTRPKVLKKQLAAEMFLRPLACDSSVT